LEVEGEVEVETVNPVVEILGRTTMARKASEATRKALEEVGNGYSSVEREEQAIVGPSEIKEQGVMTEGTRLKQLGIMLEAMEFRMTHTQDTMRQTQEGLAEWKETLQAVMEKQQEAIERCQELVEQ